METEELDTQHICRTSRIADVEMQSDGYGGIWEWKRRPSLMRMELLET